MTGRGFSQVSVRRVLLSSTAIGLLATGSLWAGSALAQDSLPAVSGVNAKIAIAGGWAHSEGYTEVNPLAYPLSLYPFATDFLDAGDSYLGLALGSLTVPLGHSFGAQIDGAAGVQEGDFIGGVGGHVFWRDPAKGLVGVTGAAAVNQHAFAKTRHDSVPYNNYYTDWQLEKQSIYRVGGEAEAYLDRVTLHGTAGYQWGENVKDGAYGAAGINFYVNDDFMVGLGGGGSAEISGFGTANFEYKPFERMAFFADARSDFNEYFQGVVGIRFYFGPSNSLIDAHRKDDPASNAAYDALSGIKSTTEVTDFLVTCCFTGETEVVMADGSVRAIRDVRPGDRVLGQNGAVNTVLSVASPVLGDRRLFALNDGPAFVTADHPLMTRSGWKSIDPQATLRDLRHVDVDRLGIGDELVTLAAVHQRAVPMVAAGGGCAFGPDYETVAETDYRRLDSMTAHARDAQTTVYNLRVDGNHSYFVNGYIAHDKTDGVPPVSLAIV